MYSATRNKPYVAMVRAMIINTAQICANKMPIDLMNLTTQAYKKRAIVANCPV